MSQGSLKQGLSCGIPGSTLMAAARSGEAIGPVKTVIWPFNIPMSGSL